MADPAVYVTAGVAVATASVPLCLRLSDCCKPRSHLVSEARQRIHAQNKESAAALSQLLRNYERLNRADRCEARTLVANFLDHLAQKSGSPSPSERRLDPVETEAKSA